MIPYRGELGAWRVVSPFDVNDDQGQTWRRTVTVVADADGDIIDQFNLPVLVRRHALPSRSYRRESGGSCD